MSALKIDDVHTARVVDNLSRTQIVQYAGASGDYNPLHTDEVYAMRVAGYPSVFAHGMLTMGLTGRMLTDLVGTARLLKFGMRFTQQVWPGDTLDVTATVRELRRSDDGGGVVVFDFSTRNQDGIEVANGYAEAQAEP